MAKAVCGDGETDVKTEALLKAYRDALTALVRHLGTTKARRNTSQAVAKAIIAEADTTSLTFGTLSDQMSTIVNIRERQAAGSQLRSAIRRNS